MSIPKESKPGVSSKGKKKKVVKIVALLALLVTAVAVGVLVRQLQNPSSPSEQSVQDDTAPKLPSVVADVQSLNGAGKTEEATQKAEEGLRDPSTPDDIKYMLYIQLGNGKFNKEDFQGAIVEYEKALAMKETYEVAKLLAGAYLQLENNAKAVEFYKKALNLVPTDSPVIDDEKEALRQTITSLGGQL